MKYPVCFWPCLWPWLWPCFWPSVQCWPWWCRLRGWVWSETLCSIILASSRSDSSPCVYFWPFDLTCLLTSSSPHLVSLLPWWQAPLGQSRSRGFSVPGPDFTFGVSSSHDQGGVAQGKTRTRPTPGPDQDQTRFRWWRCFHFLSSSCGGGSEGLPQVLEMGQEDQTRTKANT